MEPFAVLALFPILFLLAFACAPPGLVNANPKATRQLVTGIVGLELLLAVVLALSHAFGGGTPYAVSLVPAAEAGLSIYYDAITSLMLSLVAFVGFIVSRFSIRYLDSEATQGRYFCWLAFTIGAVSLMVVSGNLLMFFLAWVMTSFGLHHLLLHYRHRAAAHRAAWTKFFISRIGDAFLIGALILTFRTFGTFELSELFARVNDVSAGSQSSLTAIAWLLMLGAVTKSAQFPFHTWLPDTMETPTPVSALMHAGIVNAGGYLVIRMSPLIVQAPSALLTLAVIGAVTACFAGVVMMTQTSIKRTLAYSTVAQMGFMMLQCGLGIFSLAMLHILAHSLYKAYAFLNSGTVTSERAQSNYRVDLTSLVAAAAATVLAYLSISWALGIRVTGDPSGLVLALIICMALTTWGWRLMGRGEPRTTLIGLAGVIGLCVVYVASYRAVDYLLVTATPPVVFTTAAYWVMLGIATAFGVLFALHAALLRQHQPEWLMALRVHATNGFYVDTLYHRIFDSLAKS